ncbi:hypothetical protein OIU85_004549 [Salix viminalis]|uniref:Uncharacterized protein n=1 Tax=Salix viminalis TaxID=40686 RepID=A0A9Q0PTJ5_SALVM|nr:hypothetical protein OIU85_004549 [Salix viminalis]
MEDMSHAHGGGLAPALDSAAPAYQAHSEPIHIRAKKFRCSLDVQVQLARPSSGQGDSAQPEVPAQPEVQVHPAHPTTGQGDSSQPRGDVQVQIARSMVSWAEIAVSFRSARAQPIYLAE